MHIKFHSFRSASWACITLEKCAWEVATKSKLINDPNVADTPPA